FVMAPYNTRIVRRSAALLDHAYGRGFRYREVTGVGAAPLGPVKAAGLAAGTGGLLAGLAFPPTRLVLDRVLPSPGEGPSEEARRKGLFRMQIHADTTSGAHYVADVAAKGDPGYAATAMMMGQSALCLALDADRLPRAGGVLTPATAMGAALAERLRSAGMTLAVTPR
ncbi:MAG TPA: enoyl-ACP reductase, partial [Solirubrobacteraceae bacterium]|nr:enoyl-ACP reductase [Solirubrobacteraceae bacterium]